jgi:hypothetical protein
MIMHIAYRKYHAVVYVSASGVYIHPALCFGVASPTPPVWTRGSGCCRCVVCLWPAHCLAWACVWWCVGAQGHHHRASPFNIQTNLFCFLFWTTHTPPRWLHDAHTTNAGDMGFRVTHPGPTCGFHPTHATNITTTIKHSRDSDRSRPWLALLAPVVREGNF